MTGWKNEKQKISKGSALILTVVLTSILAIVGVMFVLASRVETLSTSSMTDERDLNLAIDTIISKLSNEMVLDVPGLAGQEYYDCPGEADKWLASIEPYYSAGVNTVTPYKWPQITDLTGYIARNFSGPQGNKDSWKTRDVSIDAEGYDSTGYKLPYYDGREVITEYPVISLDRDGVLYEQWADADGDGIADSKWIELEDLATSKGQTIYAAIRVIDNGGMLNLNTAYEFDPNDDLLEKIDGSKLHQVNLNTLPRPSNYITEVSKTRSGIADPTLDELNNYEEDGPWRFSDPCDDYTLFDVSDELELRFRNIINAPGEARVDYTWENTVRKEWSWVADRPYDTRSDWGLDEWRRRIMDPYDPCYPQYDRRHILTTYNFDRIIAPDGNSMINVNIDRGELDVNDLHNEIASWRKALSLYQKFVASIPDVNLPLSIRKRMKREYAQLAVNLVDLRDTDTDVTGLYLPNLVFVEPNEPNEPNDPNEPDEPYEFEGEEYVYGIEPFPVITQVAIRLDPNDPCHNTNYYAIELFNPFGRNIRLVPDDFSDFRVLITDTNSTYDPNDPNGSDSEILYNIPLGITTLGPDEYMVIYNLPFFNIEPNTFYQEFPELALSSGYSLVRDPRGGRDRIDPDVVNTHNVNVARRVYVFQDPNDTNDVNDRDDIVERYVFLDRQPIYKNWVRWSPDPNAEGYFYGRNFELEPAAWWDVVLAGASSITDVNGLNFLGGRNYTVSKTPSRPAMDIQIPYGSATDLRTVGDIARIWTIGPTDRLYEPPDALYQGDSVIFDPNSIDYIGPNDVNDPNGRLENFDVYARTVGEKLLFTSESINIGHKEDEDLIRLNLADPTYSDLFQYITVFDPRSDRIDNDGDGIGEGDQYDSAELKIPGRININTAPAYVIEQLPWMTRQIARAIVDYRDKRLGSNYDNRSGSLEKALRHQIGYNAWRNYLPTQTGFASIGELDLVAYSGEPNSIWEYALDNRNLRDFPDLTPTAYDVNTSDIDDFEERDMIFSRISNLATVRSDVFTAYILVRLGTDGPQKRVMAVLDRSNVYNLNDKVKIVAIQPLPHPK